MEFQARAGAKKNGVIVVEQLPRRRIEEDGYGIGSVTNAGGHTYTPILLTQI